MKPLLRTGIILTAIAGVIITAILIFQTTNTILLFYVTRIVSEYKCNFLFFFLKRIIKTEKIKLGF
ncbi:hypothetical protein [Nostoc sp.]|uniref:hypothetical protein n=1 Tax=Nostoc sp. TaxID=1180 RepID=UPI002FF4424B